MGSSSVFEQAYTRGVVAERREESVAADSAIPYVGGLAETLGTVAPGRLADLVVLERHHDDPWHNVVEAEPSWVQLVSVGGRVRYGRRELVAIVDPDADEGLEQVVAWGNRMALDTRGRSAATLARMRLGDLRRTLTDQLPQTGPIFA